MADTSPDHRRTITPQSIPKTNQLTSKQSSIGSIHAAIQFNQTIDARQRAWDACFFFTFHISKTNQLISVLLSLHRQVAQLDMQIFRLLPVTSAYLR